VFDICQTHRNLDYRKKSTLQRTRLLHAKILSPVKVNYPAHRAGHFKKLEEGDCIPLTPTPHSSPSTGRGILRENFIKNPVCSSFIMIAERPTSVISIRNQSFSSRATFYGLKYASNGWTIHCIFRAVLISGAIVPLRGASIEALFVHFLKSLRRAEVTNQYDIINDTPTRSIIFMPNFCSDWTPRRGPPPGCSSGRSASP